MSHSRMSASRTGAKPQSDSGKRMRGFWLVAAAAFAAASMSAQPSIAQASDAELARQAARR